MGRPRKEDRQTVPDAVRVVLDAAQIDSRMTAPDPSSDGPPSDEYVDVDDALVPMVRDGVEAQVHRDSVPVMAALGWQRADGA